jgi:SAM-dependent methyltransferase
MLVHCEIVSPLDAVRRRLASQETPTLQTLVAQLAQQAPTESSATVIAANEAAWNQRATDPRFAYLQSMNKEQALSAVDPWLLADGSLDNRRVLCLAAGGGTHGPLLATAGADVVVVDFSLTLLQIDQRIAEQNGLRLRTVRTSMDDLSAFESASFDCVVQPVSTCYVQDVESLYREIARVLRSGGLYVSQHKNPYSLQGDEQPTGNGYNVGVPCLSGRMANPTKSGSTIREKDMTETIHSIDSLIGGLCRGGFVVEDVVEPPHADAWAAVGTPEHRAQFLPPYLKIKARRRADSAACVTQPA